MNAHQIKVYQRMQEVLEGVESVSRSRVAVTDVRSPPVNHEANILPLPDYNDPVLGQGTDDWPGETLAAPIVYTVTNGVAVEVIKRGDDLLAAMQVAADCRVALETDQQLADMLDELVYETTQVAAGKPENQDFVLVAPIFYFTYKMARGASTRMTG